MSADLKPSPTPGESKPILATLEQTAPAHVPGWKTSEFWVVFLSILGLVIESFKDALPPGYAAVAVAIASGCYALSRGLVKMFARF